MTYTQNEYEEILGYPGYVASVRGEIIKVKNWRIKKQRPVARGGLRVDIGKSSRMVHHLMALAFYGRHPRGFRIRHLNGDMTDNRLENLAWSGSIASIHMPVPLEIEREYESIIQARYELIELMQT